MDGNSDSETGAHLAQLLAVLVRRLRVLDIQAAGFGPLAMPAHLELEREDARREIARLRGELRRTNPDHSSLAPYVGLASFQEESAGLFFGRDALVAELIERVEHGAFLAVLGASGSGKSSLVRAGLLPALKGGALAASAAWRYLVLKPGARPLDALAAELTKLQAGDLHSALHLAEQLANNPRALLLAADLLLDRQQGQRLVLVVDQLEELWTLASPGGAGQQPAFLQQLAAAQATPDSPVLTIATMRADFLHRVAEQPALARAISANNLIVGPLARDELRDAIERPAELAGCGFEPGLAGELIEQVHGQAGALPLLEYTLLQLWKARQPDGTMTWEAFRALGGVEGALAAQADELLKRHYAEAQLERLRGVLVRLVQPGQPDTRKRVPLDELLPAGMAPDELRALLRPLIDERLLTSASDPAGGAELIELTHEALITAWPTLGRWLQQAGADLRFQSQLADAAKEWHAGARNAGLLWSGLRLSNAEEWLVRATPQLSEREQAFLAASQAQQRERQAAEQAARAYTLQLERQARRRLQVAVALLSLVLLASAPTIYAAIESALQRRAARAEGQLLPIAGFEGGLRMERYEVTNARWARCVAARVCLPPPQQVSSYFDQAGQQLPIVGVDASQASEFCQWIGRRLPTRAEWSYAATRGTASPSPEQANLYNGAKGAAMPVGQHPQGATPDGVEDLIGNVQEWTRSAWSEGQQAGADWSGDELQVPDQLVAIGGGYYSAPNGLDPQPTSSYTRLPDLGFRCVE